MTGLPVEQAIPDIRQALRDGNRLVLVAPPGAGKTTLVPLALLNEPWLDGRMIILLEPRRLAARNAAARMAALLGEQTGDTVGYRIRAERAGSERTRILVVTEGILTRMLQADPELATTALVIFDEFHERNLHADLSLAFCLQSQELLRADLRLLVMSATLDAAGVSRLLDDAPVVTSTGQTFPVETYYLPDRAPRPEPGRISEAVMRRLERVLAEETGSVLVFLPGVREIRQVEQALAALPGQLQEKPVVAPLYGDLSREQQDRAIQPCAAGRRKIVLATNIAETSLTIEGVAIVIDSGLERQARFDPGSGMNRLETVFISGDSADQRSGRAGRLGPGRCYRLWTAAHQLRMARHGTPEILRSDLASLVLETVHWGVREPGELRWLDPPNAGAVAQARELLRELGAIDDTPRITAHGRLLLDTGAHPRIAHMMIRGAQAGHGFDACLLAALLTERDIFTAGGARPADVAPRLALLRSLKQDAGATRNEDVNRQQCRLVLRSAQEFHRRIRHHERQAGAEAIDDRDLPGVLLAWAYPDRIGRVRHGAGNRYLLRSGKGAFLDAGEALATAEFIVAADLDGRAREARIRLAAEITLQQIEARFADDMTRITGTGWNAQTQGVDAVTRTCLGAIVLEQQPAVDIAREKIHAALLAGIRQSGIDCLPWDVKARALRQRVAFLRLQRSAVDDPALGALELPDLSDGALLENLEHWLLPYLDAHNSIRKLQSLDLHAILLGTLDRAQQQALDRLAPTHVTVPSGSRIAIDYSDPDNPVLAVRLQELFGLQQTPAIINGRYSLLLHLLSPGYKPMQVTQDLASFWQTTYFEVRKELRGRYKKHHWPEDPLAAQATSRAKRRGET